jgi:ADP-ribose pyrophosphatase YjhB (NUDIX family)
MKIKIKLNEGAGVSSGTSVPFGGLSPGYAGTFGNNAGTIVVPHKATKNIIPDEDTYVTVKACLHRNNMVLLLKNEKGWDLPGGHLKLGEAPVDGLKREIFEETGLNIEKINMVGPPTRKKRFFCATFLTDDVHLSNEHYEYKFFQVDEIKKLDELNETFRSVILKCLGTKKEIKKISRIKVDIKI